VSEDLGGWGGAEFVLAADRLDTPDVVEAADPGDMLRQVASAAAQVRTALRSCAETDLSVFTPDGRPRAIVVAGMGGSGLAGEMLTAMTGLSSPVQVVISQAGRLPGWVGAADAVLAVSCSGATPETLAVATEAARRGCRLACVGAGESPLHRIAEQARAPFVPVVPASPPRGGTGGSSPPEPALPRSMLWAVSIPLLVIGERLGVTRIRPGRLRAGGDPAGGGVAPVPPGQRVVRQPGQVTGPGPGRRAADGLGHLGAERGRGAAVRQPAA